MDKLEIIYDSEYDYDRACDDIDSAVDGLLEQLKGESDG